MYLATGPFFAFLCLFGHSNMSLSGSLLAFRSLTTKEIVRIISVKAETVFQPGVESDLNLHEQTLKASRL